MSTVKGTVKYEIWIIWNMMHILIKHAWNRYEHAVHRNGQAHHEMFVWSMTNKYAGVAQAACTVLNCP